MQRKPSKLVEVSAAASSVAQQPGPLKLQPGTPVQSHHIEFKLHSPVAFQNEKPQAERYLILRFSAKNDGHTAVQLPYDRSLHIRLFHSGGKEVEQTYARDSGRRVPALTPLIDPSKTFDFDRLGSWVYHGHSIASIFLDDESGGVTNFEGLHPGRYFFTADYAFKMPGGTASPVHAIGEPFDIH